MVRVESRNGCRASPVVRGGDVDPLNAVVLGKQQTNVTKLRSNERLAPRKIEILKIPELEGKLTQFLVSQIVPLVQVSPIEAMFACQVANGVDEQD
jgi:hypothetical protein